MKVELAVASTLPPDRSPESSSGAGGDADEQSTEATEREPPASDLGESQLLERLARAEAELERERAQAPALCDELLSVSPRLQMQRAERDPILHTWGVCEDLLRRSVAVEESDPDACARLAFLALAVAAHLDGDLGSTPIAKDLEARAWACVGGSCLRFGNLPGAEEALREAAEHLGHGTGDLLLEARLLEFEASVRRTQGQLREAAVLLKQAELRYREINEPDLAARVRAEREKALTP